MKRLTKEWVKKAEADLLAATALADEDLSVHEVVCFHCQHAAEKYLKALLQESGDPVPRTHDLVELLSLVTPHYPVRGLPRGLKSLSDFAVEPRYPGKSATKRQAQAALRWAGKVRAACRGLLGLPSPRKRT
jgi:HEPN domain-containing protein